MHKVEEIQLTGYAYSQNYIFCIVVRTAVTAQIKIECGI